MTTATMSQPPAIPPRPAKNQDRDESGGSLPKIPPRPVAKRFERSISPNPDRFAPSPLHEGIPPKSPKTIRFSANNDAREHSGDPIDRSGSVPMPSVGEEGVEYSTITTELQADAEEEDKASSTAPEQTRTIAQDLKLHAPKPSLPAHSAKQRVQTVTRTDSEKAASFGIGRPSSRDLKKKPSTSFSANSDGQPEFDEQGIPEIGQRVPMNPLLGDVQAPSPAPGSEEFKKHHSRKHSSRGGPPGSYGLHGHGVTPQDQLDKAYYEKHPELLEKEKKPTPIHDRQNDYAMSSKELNQLVRETARRGSGLGTSNEYHATPTDEVGFQASEEYAARITSPPPANQRAPSFRSEVTGPDGEKSIHVDDPEHPEYRSPGDEVAIDDEENGYEAPILAEDEVGKDNRPYLQQPAVHPPPERRGSANEMEDAPSRPASRPSSRPTSMYLSNASQEFEHTQLDDVKEYEPLFPEEAKEAVKKQAADENKTRHHFPSKDVWEDAPNSVHYTAEVSTPDLSDQQRRRSSASKDRPKTPAHIFAQQQEELAEREVGGHASTYLPRAEETEKPIWPGRPQQAPKQARPGLTNRFPSKDVWEDVPESLLYEAEVSASPKGEAKPEIPSRPAKKPETSERPAIPGRPKPRQTPSDESKPRPPISDKPKPQIPPRPTKSSPSESQGEVSKPKPPVPSRPVGGKIAALQAGFMSDLNKRLQLGPQAPKKEEPKPQEDLTEEKEKAPLSDARKGRARGPQRRAPARSPAAAAAPATAETKTAESFSFSSPQTFWSIDPDDGDVIVFGEEKEVSAPAPAPEEKVDSPVVSPQPVEKAEVAEVADPPAVSVREEDAEEPSEEPLQKKASEELEAPVKEEKTLVANTVGESVLETTMEKKDDKVDPVDVEDTPKA